MYKQLPNSEAEGNVLPVLFLLSTPLQWTQILGVICSHLMVSMPKGDGITCYSFR